jgi:hypothetical protein
MVSGLMVYYDGCWGDLNEFLGGSKEVSRIRNGLKIAGILPKNR